MEIKLFGTGSKEELENRIRTIATAGRLSRNKGKIQDVVLSCDDYEKNLSLIERIISMGHKSIIEHDYLVFSLSDVSPIVEQTIIGSRLSSFTIKSRREVDFRNVGFRIPTFRNNNNCTVHECNDELEYVYKEHIQSLFNEYGNFVDAGIKTEDARFMLPYCYNSEIMMGIDAHSLEKLIVLLTKTKYSKISELSELGQILTDVCCESVPYLVPSINKIELHNDEPFPLIDDINIIKKPKILTEPVVTRYTINADDVVLYSALMGYYQIDRNSAREVVVKMEEKDPDIRKKLMKVIMTKDFSRELEQATFQFQIPISLSILTHLTRHRMHSLITPDFVPMWDMDNYIVPPVLEKEHNALLKEKYDEAFKKNKEMYEFFKSQGVMEEDLVYFYLGGQMCNVLTNMNARTLQWITKMRSCTKAQWEIRDISNKLIDLVAKEAPLIACNLGPTCVTENKCYEGKESCGRNKLMLEQK